MNKKKPLNVLGSKLVGGILPILVAAIAGFGGGWLGATSKTADLYQKNESSQQVVSDESELISSIAKNVGESVVSVNVNDQVEEQESHTDESPQHESSGTGVIINSNGTVLTNRHVVPEGISSVSVTLSDGTKLENVDVIKRANDGDALDIAFLKIKDTEGRQLKAAKLGDSTKLKVGSKVIAIGNALGEFQNSVTTGIISGYGRKIEAGGESEDEAETLKNLFQTDAAINEGNSGGPLVSINGEVIGINTAVAGDGAENIGFAIPINDIKGLIPT